MTATRHKIENVETGVWHRIIDDLKAAGFVEVYRYAGPDAGIDYSRYDLKNGEGDELIVFEWDNWTEGEITATASRLAALREQYRLARPTEAED